MIGVLVVDIEPFSAELLKGVARAIHGTGYELVVFSGCGRAIDQDGWERRYLQRVSGTLTDGAILVTPTSVDVTYGAPVVAVDHNVALVQPARRSTPTTSAARLRRPSTCSGSDTGGSASSPAGPTSSRRGCASAATARALEGAGIKIDAALDPRRRLPGRLGRGGRRAAARAGRPPDGDLRRQRRLGHRDDRRSPARSACAVPEDLSVIGFDNVPESALCEPPLTTIEQPIQQMGFDAIQILIRLIEDATASAEHTMLPTRLVVRDSLPARSGDGA